MRCSLWGGSISPQPNWAFHLPRLAPSHADHLLERYPEHELAIRRLRARDPEFRAVCDDLEAVLQALERWQGSGREAPRRIEEYRRLLAELEAEALAFLKQPGRNPSRCG